jgi:hypothetical protein
MHYEMSSDYEPPHNPTDGDSLGSLGRATAMVAVPLLAAILAIGTTWVAGLTDGVPTNEYDAGNRAALGLLTLGTLVAFPIGSLVAYAICRMMEFSIFISIVCSELAIAIVGGIVVAAWVHH